jgi:hypothetical protein
VNCCDDFGMCQQGPSCAIRMTTGSDTGHKVAHGKRTDYFGRAAQCPVELPTLLLEVQYPGYIRWMDKTLNWCEKHRFYTACILTGAAIGIGYGLGRFLKLL